MADKTFVMKDMGMKDIEARFAELAKGSVVVGYPGDGPMHESGQFTVAALAITHEFGVPDNNLPARPFMKQTWNLHKGDVRYKQRLAFGMALRGRWSPRQALARLGIDYEDKIRDTIDNGNFVPLKAETIRRKGSSRILIDTGDLRRRVTSKVVGL